MNGIQEVGGSTPPGSTNKINGLAKCQDREEVVVRSRGKRWGKRWRREAVATRLSTGQHGNGTVADRQDGKQPVNVPKTPLG